MKSATYLALSLLLLLAASCKKNETPAPANVSTSGTIKTTAGNGTQGFSGDGGQETAAELYFPGPLTFDNAGNLYVVDIQNSRVRKISPNGVINTVAGNGTINYSTDGVAATSTGINANFAILDGAGNIYISDFDNHCVRKVNTSGIITTFAGGGISGLGNGGPATAAQMNAPTGMVFDAAGNLYIADLMANTIRVVNTSGIINAFAGNGSAGYSGDGGPASAAEFNFPQSLVINSGNLYVSDLNNCRIREINSAGIVTTFAGNGLGGYSGDGGPATAAEMSPPGQMAFDASGNLIFADGNNNRIRKIDVSGNITTIIGNGTRGFSGDGGAAINAELYSPDGVAIDASGNIFITDTWNNRIREMLK